MLTRSRSYEAQTLIRYPEGPNGLESSSSPSHPELTIHIHYNPCGFPKSINYIFLINLHVQLWISRSEWLVYKPIVIACDILSHNF